MESNTKFSSQEDKIMTRKIKTSEIIIQTLASLCITFQSCQSGFVTSWPSYNAALFQSNETVLSMPMTSTHISLLGSLYNVGGLLVTPFLPYFFNTFGRKYATTFFGFIFAITWTMIAFSNNIYLILFAMALFGIGIAGQGLSTIFISEIANDSIRGGLTACPSSGYFVGLFFSNLMSGYLSYNQVVYTFLSLSLLGVILLLLLKESPVYLVLIGKEKEAAKSIAFYRRLDETSKDVEDEISKIKQQLDPRSEPLLQGDYELVATNESVTAKELTQPAKKISSWSFLKNSKSSQRSLFKMLCLMTLTSMMGPVLFQGYGEFIFTAAVPSLDPNKCGVGVGLVFMVSSFICILAIDRCGRKSLLVSTSIICAICSLLFGTVLQFHWTPDWLTAVFIYSYCFSYTSGAVTVPYVLIAEVFPPEVRSLCNTIAAVSLWVSNFICLAPFHFLVEMLGMGPVFYIFSIICFTTAIYSAFCIPETKGLSVAEIQKLFVKEKELNKA